MSYKIAALVLVIFVGGIVSGIVLLQLASSNANTANQSEKVEITSSTAWVSNDWSHSQAAIIVTNNGNGPAVLREITVRGIECSWIDVYYWKANIGAVSGELTPVENEFSGSYATITVDEKEQTFQQANDKITLNAYQTIVLYIRNPGDITIQNFPSKVTIAVFTEKDMVSQEASVNAIGFTGPSSVTITSVSFSDDGATPPAKTIVLTLTKTGTRPLTIVQAKVNNSVATGTELPLTLTAGESSGTLTLTGMYVNWVAGNPYKIDLYDSSGQVAGSYMGTAPS